MVDKKVFAKRFKESYKKKGYTHLTLALKLNVSTDTVKNWSSPNRDSMPKDMDMLSSIAKLLDVDVAYLWGEIDCKHYSEQTIVDVTGLSEKSASVLCGLDSMSIEALDFLLSHNNFNRLLYEVWNYGHAHNRIIKLIDEPLNNVQTIRNPSMIKFAPSESFKNILDDYYNSNSEELGNVAVYHSIQKILGYLKEYENWKNYNDTHIDYQEKFERFEKSTKECIEIEQNHIKKYDTQSFFVNNNCDTLLENATMILDSYDDMYNTRKDRK
jgi:DNA-binding XRE family transcriptional regulator